jgi:hypothetical protein
MFASHYHFVTNWRFEDTRIEEVADILEDFGALSRWWPSVYLGVEVERPGGAHALGAVISLFTKGWLPYTLRWRFTVVEERYPRGSTLVASGDFDGRGVWTLIQKGPLADVTYDWSIEAEKPLLRTMTPVLRPIFSANHRWAMARGEESLRLELARRRARTDAERSAIPAPPGPTFRPRKPQ